MSFKKSVSFLLIASQLTWALPSFAQDSSSATTTPEVTLLESVISLEGQTLTQAELQTQIQSAEAQYLKAAPQDGQTERMESALVTMGIYTQDQAHQYIADSQVAAKTAWNQSGGNASAFQAAVNEQMMNLGRLHPAGAQFSGCAVAGIIFGGAFLTGVSLLPGQDVTSTRAEIGSTMALLAFLVGAPFMLGLCND